MAKLSAHGVELLRLRREFFIEGEKPVFHSPLADSGTTFTNWVKVKTKHFEERSYRSDGHIMSKSGFWQEATSYQAAHWYDWGWKLFRKLRTGVSMPDHVFSVKASLANRQTVTAEDWRIVE